MNNENDYIDKYLYITLIIIGICSIILILFLGLSPVVMRLATSKQEITSILSKASHQKVEIDGKISFYLLPRPRLVIENVSLKNEYPSLNINLLKVDKLELYFSLKDIIHDDFNKAYKIIMRSPSLTGDKEQLITKIKILTQDIFQGDKNPLERITVQNGNLLAYNFEKKESLNIKEINLDISTQKQDFWVDSNFKINNSKIYSSSIFLLTNNSSNIKVETTFKSSDNNMNMDVISNLNYNEVHKNSHDINLTINSVQKFVQNISSHQNKSFSSIPLQIKAKFQQENDHWHSDHFYLNVNDDIFNGNIIINNHQNSITIESKLNSNKLNLDAQTKLISSLLYQQENKNIVKKNLISTLTSLKQASGYAQNSILPKNLHFNLSINANNCLFLNKKYKTLELQTNFTFKNIQIEKLQLNNNKQSQLMFSGRIKLSPQPNLYGIFSIKDNTFSNINKKLSNITSFINPQHRYLEIQGELHKTYQKIQLTNLNVKDHEKNIFNGNIITQENTFIQGELQNINLTQSVHQFINNLHRHITYPLLRTLWKQNKHDKYNIDLKLNNTQLFNVTFNNSTLKAHNQNNALIIDEFNAHDESDGNIKAKGVIQELYSTPKVNNFDIKVSSLSLEHYFDNRFASFHLNNMNGDIVINGNIKNFNTNIKLANKYKKISINFNDTFAVKKSKLINLDYQNLPNQQNKTPQKVHLTAKLDTANNSLSINNLILTSNNRTNNAKLLITNYQSSNARKNISITINSISTDNYINLFNYNILHQFIGYNAKVNLTIKKVIFDSPTPLQNITLEIINHNNKIEIPQQTIKLNNKSRLELKGNIYKLDNALELNLNWKITNLPLKNLLQTNNATTTIYSQGSALFLLPKEETDHINIKAQLIAKLNNLVLNQKFIDKYDIFKQLKNILNLPNTNTNISANISMKVKDRNVNIDNLNYTNKNFVGIYNTNTKKLLLKSIS